MSAANPEFDANYANLEVNQISVFSPATDPNHVITKSAMEDHVDGVKTEVKSYTDDSIAAVVGLGTPENLNTLKELARLSQMTGQCTQL